LNDRAGRIYKSANTTHGVSQALPALFAPSSTPFAATGHTVVGVCGGASTQRSGCGGASAQSGWKPRLPATFAGMVSSQP
jgi:hypothetical protein